MMKSIAFIALSGTASALISTGSCPSFETIPGFDAKQYMGRWYDILGDPTNPGQLGSQCEWADYKLNSDGSVHVLNKAKYPVIGYYGIEGRAVCSANGNGACEVEFFGKKMTGVNNYNILKLDYNGLSYVYNCFQLGPLKTEVFWLLSRKPVLTGKEIEGAYDFMKKAVPSYDVKANTSVQMQSPDCKYD